MAKGEGMGLLLLGKPKGEEGDSDDDGALSAARAALKAIKAGDAAGLSEALRLHYDMCSAEGMSEEE